MPFEHTPSEPARAPADKAAAHLVVAADLPDADAALTLAADLSGLPLWLKIGLELFCAAGPDVVRAVNGRGFAVFLDLKYHDIPNTVRGAVRSACGLGARMLSLHVSGGEAMCRAAVAGRDESAAKGAPFPLLMGITVLTSQGGDEAALRGQVVERALEARAWGLDGVVCSGHEAAAVKAACGQDFLCLCPGIRFAGHAGGDDQARVCTPGRAVAEGADFVVMGRPVLQAASPRSAALDALEQMRGNGPA